MSLDEEEGRSSKPAVSVKHAMSRVKDQLQQPSSRQQDTDPTLAPDLLGATPAIAHRADNQPRSATGSLDAARLSIESGVSFNEEEDEQDLDSPRNRGRQYDDRWKVPGHAESVLASFVERLEKHHGHVPDGGVDEGESSVSAALAEARADREASVAVLNSNGRLVSDRLTRRNAAPTAVASAGRSAQGLTDGKKRRSNGGGKGKVGGKGREGGARTKRIDSKARVDASPLQAGDRHATGGGGGGGPWSRFGGVIQSFQRAAEAITGMQKEEEGRRDHQGVDLERTKDVVTAFLSSNRGFPERDQE